MSLKSQIQKVLKEKSVMDYLSSLGHYPVKTLSGGKYGFICPFDDHKETKPSFIVYTQSEYENWYCFGCNRSHSIINLVSYLEKIPFKAALEKLSEGSIISTEEDISFVLSRIQNEDIREPIDELSKTLLQISWQCLLFSQGVDFDQKEMYIIDKYFSLVDKNIIDYDFEKITETASALPSFLKQRQEMWRKTQEAQKITNK